MTVINQMIKNIIEIVGYDNMNTITEIFSVSDNVRIITDNKKFLESNIKLFSKTEKDNDEKDDFQDDLEIHLMKMKLILKKENKKKKAELKARNAKDDKIIALENIGKLFKTYEWKESELELFKKIKESVNKLIPIKKSKMGNELRNAKDRERKAENKNKILVCPYCNQHRMTLLKFNEHISLCGVRSKKTETAETIINRVQKKEISNFNNEYGKEFIALMRKEIRDVKNRLL